MEKLILLFLFFLLSENTMGQFTFLKPIPNIVIANEEKGVINVGFDYVFELKQVKLAYNINERYFIFGTYNYDNSTSTYRGGIKLFGFYSATREKENSGFSIGGGIQKIGEIGGYKNLELIAGIERQSVNNLEYPTGNKQIEDQIIHEYYKIFTQFNMTRNRTNWNLGYSMKVSYLKFTEYKTNSVPSLFEGKFLVLVDPTINLHLKLLRQKRLMFSFQTGLSVALNELKGTMSDGVSTSIEREGGIIRPILKVGAEYKFDFQRKGDK